MNMTSISDKIDALLSRESMTQMHYAAKRKVQKLAQQLLVPRGHSIRTASSVSSKLCDPSVWNKHRKLSKNQWTELILKSV
jgi:hypothetical protein